MSILTGVLSSRPAIYADQTLQNLDGYKRLVPHLPPLVSEFTSLKPHKENPYPYLGGALKLLNKGFALPSKISHLPQNIHQVGSILGQVSHQLSPNFHHLTPNFHHNNIPEVLSIIANSVHLIC